jgi:hypothetical protein
MNKKIKLVSFCLLGLVAFTACKKEVSSEGAKFDMTSGAGSFDEQSKKDIEKTANAMMDKLEGVNELESVGASVNLLSLLNKDNSSDAPSNNPAFMPIAILNSVAEFGNTGSTKYVEKTLKGGTSSDNSLANFEEAKGEYVWDGKEFVKSPSNQIIIRFPSREGGANDAMYSVAYEENNSKTILPEGVITPALVDAKLTVSGKVLLQFTFKSAFDNQGMPTFVQSKLIIAPFSFEHSMNANSSEVGQEFSFRKSGEILIGMSMGIKGSFTSDDVKAILDSGNEDAEELDPKSIKSVYTNFQLLDLIIKSELDVAGALKVSDLNNAQDNMEQLNSYYKAGLYYNTTGRKIADLQFYSKVSDSQSTVESTETSIRLVFPDKSKVDLSTYLQGFDKLTEDFEARLDEAMGKDEEK